VLRAIKWIGRVLCFSLTVAILAVGVRSYWVRDGFSRFSCELVYADGSTQNVIGAHLDVLGIVHERHARVVRSNTRMVVERGKATYFSDRMIAEDSPDQLRLNRRIALVTTGPFFQDYGQWIYTQSAPPIQSPAPSWLGFAYQRTIQARLVRTERTYLTIPFWGVVVIPILLLGAFLIPLRRKRRNRSNANCPKCNYDLRASKDRCPECGHPIPNPNPAPPTPPAD
jgi:hypothetical protein